MLLNRSVPGCTVIPVLYYPDPAAAADWLCRAFGFSVRLRIGNHRIQMHAGDGCFIIAEGAGPSDRADLGRAHATMIRVEDARACCERARAAGARILQEPADHMYGERQFNAEDFAGHRWTFTQSLADVAPETWGGTPVNL
jgi:uncharacterized glyoxalase superfamily protein PhnB